MDYQEREEVVAAVDVAVRRGLRIRAWVGVALTVQAAWAFWLGYHLGERDGTRAVYSMVAGILVGGGSSTMDPDGKLR